MPSTTFIKRIHIALGTALFKLILAALIFTSQPAVSLERQTFGQNAYPIWSPLSFFERETIAQRHAAMSGDPDALLALFILASGRYELADYERIEKLIDRFASTFDSKTGNKLDPWKKGELLNSSMHHAFFGLRDAENSKQSKLSNYDLDQSALTGIFKNNTFNCISSSLLYAVLLRKLGFDAQGVMLPSHAFIQINLEDGRKVEVETTSPSGYDQHHDEAFYERAANNWFNTRGLPPSTFEDYLNRELIPLWQLGTRNMLHQHTHPGRMTDIDRGRLAEISAFIDPTYEISQNNRIHYYTSEIGRLSERNQWLDIVRLVQTVMPQLDNDVPDFIHNEALQNSYFWIHLIAMQAFAYEQDISEFSFYIEKTIRLSDTNERLQRTKGIAVSSAEKILENLVKAERFNEALDVIYHLEQYAADHPHYATLVAKLYQGWSRYFWALGQWPDVVATLEDYLLQPYLLEDLSVTNDNISRAYKNWVIEAIKNHDRNILPAITLQCESQHALTNICNAAIQAAKK